MPGLLCIGDAAHAMSPVGGIGINIAIQDAVATANMLTEPLRTGDAHRRTLRGPAYREGAVHKTQRVQVFAHRILNRVLHNPGPVKPALATTLPYQPARISVFPHALSAWGAAGAHPDETSIGKKGHPFGVAFAFFLR